MANLSTNQITVQYVIDDSQIRGITNSFGTLTKEEKEAILQARRLNEELRRTSSEGSNNINKMGQQMNGLGGVAKSVGKLIGGAFTVYEIKQFTQEVINTTAKFENYQRVLNFTAGSQKQGAISMAFLQQTSQKLGISLEASVDGFVKLSGATKQAGLSNDQTRRIFENVSKAVSAFGLSSEDAKGVFLALGQIMSKGTVQAEELRGQIGERIPGAFAIAAKSIGVTERELNKLLEGGKVVSKDFILPFTEQLAKATAEAGGANGLAQNIAKIGNAFDVLQTRLGRQFLPQINQIGGALEKALFFANQFLETSADREATDNMKAYESATRQAAKASNDALKASIVNANANIRALEADYKLQADIIAADGKLTDAEKEQADLLAAKILKTQAFRDGLFAVYQQRLKDEELNSQSVATAEEQAKLDKKAYDQRLKLLDLIRQIQITEAEMIGNRAGEFAAERRYAEEVYNLTVEYSKKNIGILAEEVKLKKALRDKAVQDFKTAQALEFMEIKVGSERTKKQKEQDDKEMEDLHKAGVDRMLAWSKQYEADQKFLRDKAVEDTKKAEELKQEYITQSLELAQTLFTGFTNLYKQGLDAQLNSIEKRYDEEIRLAGDNEQKVMELNEKKRQAEKEIKTKQFRADQINAVANVLFQSAPQIVKYSVTAPPLAAIVAAIAAAQTGFILAQPVPEFAKGTRGKAHKGKAIVGEEGRELVVTESGKTYLTPGTASLVDFKERSHILPANITERMMGSYYANRTDAYSSGMATELKEIKGLLANLPVHALELNERGFEKFIRTPRRSTKILNARNG
jgi:tape measure domain-containing protein